MTYDTQQLRDDLRRARSINPRLLRVLEALQTYNDTPNLKLLASAPESLRSALLPVAIQQAQTRDPEALTRITAHLIGTQAAVKLATPPTPTVNTGTRPKTAPRPTPATTVTAEPVTAEPAAAVTPEPAAKTEPVAKPPAQPVPVTPPPAPVKPEPVFTPAMAEAATRLDELKAWTLPELSRYLLSVGVEIHPKDLKRLRGRQILEHFPEGLPAALAQTPPNEVYTDPDDARNTSSPHYERFFDLQSMMPEFTQTRDAAFVAKRMRELTEGRPYIDRRMIERLRNGEFNAGREWVIEPSYLDAVMDALVQVRVEVGRETPVAEEPETQPLRSTSDFPTTAAGRLKALREAFGTRSFAVGDARRILGGGSIEVIQHLLRMSDAGHAEYLRHNTWRLVP